MENQIISMPMVALRGMTVLPEMVIHFDVSRKRSIEAIQKAMQSKEQKVFLVSQRELNIEEPKQKDLYEIGTVATVKQIAKMSKNVFRVLVVGEQRAKLLQIDEEDPCLMGSVFLLEEDDAEEKLNDNPEAKNLQQLFFEYTLKNGKIPKDIIAQIADIKSFRSLVYQIASNVPMDYINHQEILEKMTCLSVTKLWHLRLQMRWRCWSLGKGFRQK